MDTASRGPAARTLTDGRAPWIAIFVAAVVVRALFLASGLVPSDYLTAGYHVEVEAAARSLVAGTGYANPYLIPTGPTAHPLPIQTGLQALIFLAFGASLAAGYARAAAGILTLAASLALLPWLSSRLGLGRRAGVVGGAVASLVPWNGLGDALGWWWNETNAAIALAVLLAAFVSRWDSTDAPRAGTSLALGFFTGFAFHLAPSLLPVVAACAAFELRWRKGRAWRSSLAVLALGALLACVPWTLRNYVTLGEPFFIRSNVGLELRLGNHDGARADLWSTPGAGRLHPGNDLGEARRVRALGEAAYMRECRDDTIQWIAGHPVEFLRLTASRMALVWFGPPSRPLEAVPVAALSVLALAGLRRAWGRLEAPHRAALLIPLVTYPLVYYLVGYVPRYTMPLQGLLLILASASLVPQPALSRTPGAPSATARS